MRCNLIDPVMLSDQHLNAERRELRMIPPLIKKRLTNGIVLTDRIPEHFTLGTGHMLFWIDKMRYLENRFNLLTKEMLERGFNPDLSITLEVDLAKANNLYNDWEPCEDDFVIIKKRIREKLSKRFGWYKYYGLPISVEWLERNYPYNYNAPII